MIVQRKIKSLENLKKIIFTIFQITSCYLKYNLVDGYYPTNPTTLDHKKEEVFYLILINE